MSIQQMFLGVGGSGPGSIFTLDSTSYDLATGDCTVTTSGHYTLTAPTGGVKFKLFLWGGAGGAGPNNVYKATHGSAGGYAYGEFELDAGDYSLLIGANGAQAGATGYNANAFPDGGKGHASRAGAGGGSTRFGPTVANNAASYNATSFTYYLIAGGGGGGAHWILATDSYWTSLTEKGEGGGTAGGEGGMYFSNDGSSSYGLGGTQSAGGAGGTGGRDSAGNAGAKYSGADSNSGGGGGGGYYGGGGSAGYYAQSGGGSGYINTSVVSNGVLARGGTGSSLAYDKAYDGPNSEQPSNAGDGNPTSSTWVNPLPTSLPGAAVFKLLS